MRRSVFLAVAIVAVSVVSLVGTHVAEGSHPDSRYFHGLMPFTGRWANASEPSTHPSQHHRVECEPATSGSYNYVPACAYGPGDWSTDLYAAPGTNVKFYPIEIPLGSAWYGKVWSVQSTCSGGPSVAGKSVFIDLYNNGVYEGWISYGHLDQVSVSPGQIVGYHTVVGKLKRWSYSTCYQVTTDSGVHTH